MLRHQPEVLSLGWMLMLGCDTPHSESLEARRHTRQRSAVLRLRLCDLVGSLSVTSLQRGGCMHDEAYSVTQHHQCS